MSCQVCKVEFLLIQWSVVAFPITVSTPFDLDIAVGETLKGSPTHWHLPAGFSLHCGWTMLGLEVTATRTQARPQCYSKLVKCTLSIRRDKRCSIIIERKKHEVVGNMVQ